MSSNMKLQDKYHPKEFNSVFGLASVKKFFEDIETAKQHHAYLFTGDPGVGKTTVAHIIGNLFGLDVTEVNAGVDSGKDDMVSLINDLDKPTLFGKARLLIVDECHALSKQAQDALLKPLGDKQNKGSEVKGLKNDYIILCTTERSKVRKALADRCRVIPFPNLTAKEINDLLFHICEQEGIEIDPNVWEAIIDNSGGSARVAVKLLGEYVETGDTESIMNYVDEDNPQLFELYQACWDRKVSAVDLVIKARESELGPEAVRRGLINMFSATISKNTAGSPKCFAALEALFEYGFLSDNVDNKAKLAVILRNVKNSL